jgi:hypothetical protein
MNGIEKFHSKQVINEKINDGNCLNSKIFSILLKNTILMVFTFIKFIGIFVM